jgi:hypothetical protein
VDGDGVPEIIKVEWHKDPVLRRFTPRVKILAVGGSGVNIRDRTGRTSRAAVTRDPNLLGAF